MKKPTRDSEAYHLFRTLSQRAERPTKDPKDFYGKILWEFPSGRITAWSHSGHQVRLDLTTGKILKVLESPPATQAQEILELKERVAHLEKLTKAIK